MTDYTGSPRRRLDSCFNRGVKMVEGTTGGFSQEEVQHLTKEAVDGVLGTNSYQHAQVNQWTSNIVEATLGQLTKLSKPYKYIVTCVIMQKNGAGLHLASSCYWDNTTDGKEPPRVFRSRVHTRDKELVRTRGVITELLTNQLAAPVLAVIKRLGGVYSVPVRLNWQGLTLTPIQPAHWQRFGNRCQSRDWGKLPRVFLAISPASDNNS